MTHDFSRRSAAGIAGLFAGMAIVAACGGTASPNPSAAVSAAASVAASVASPAPSPSSAPSGSASGLPSFALPSGFNADTDLEKQLPDKLGDETLQKLSFKGADFLNAGSGTDSQQFKDLLTALGKSPDDFSVAVAAALTSKTTLGAFRIAGTDAGQVLPQFLTAATKDTAGATVADVTVGGKSVKKLEAPSETTTYVYAHGDVIFFVEQETPNQTTLNEAFSKLP